MNMLAQQNLLQNAYKKTSNFLKNVEKNKEKYIAQTISKKYYISELPPIWPDKITVAERFIIHLRNMPEDCLSLLDRDNKIIYLTRDNDLLKKWENFALAHILGKWFMDHLSSSFNPASITNMSGHEEDLQANKFASYLLMPDNFVREYAWLEEDFATVFRVPQEVVDFRMLLP